MTPKLYPESQKDAFINGRSFLLHNSKEAIKIHPNGKRSGH